MKQFLTNFIKFFFGNPIFPTIAVICSVLIVFLTADSTAKPKEKAPENNYKIAALQYAASVAKTTSTTSSTSTSTTSAETTRISTASTTVSAALTSMTETTEIPIETEHVDDYATPVYNYLAAGESPNSGFYQDRLVIIGDSIAYGFNAYGYIPYEHNIAAESLAVWNMGNYTFDLGGGPMGVYDAAEYAYSPLYYISIGMNDIYSYSPDDYAWNMRWIAEDILARVPTATIVVGAITPVSDGNYYTSNDVIRDFNYSLEWVINDLGSEQVLFFNTHDVLCDQNTMALGWDFAGGDGLHLNSSAYSQILCGLFNYLDTTRAIEQIEAHEENYG